MNAFTLNCSGYDIALNDWKSIYITSDTIKIENFKNEKQFQPFKYKEWLKFVDFIENKCDVYDWQEKYIDNTIEDGMSWSIIIDNIKYSSGCNAYPKQWKKFMKYIDSLIKFYKKKK